MRIARSAGSPRRSAASWCRFVRALAFGFVLRAVPVPAESSVRGELAARNGAFVPRPAPRSRSRGLYKGQRSSDPRLKLDIIRSWDGDGGTMVDALAVVIEGSQLVHPGCQRSERRAGRGSLDFRDEVPKPLVLTELVRKTLPKVPLQVRPNRARNARKIAVLRRPIGEVGFQ